MNGPRKIGNGMESLEQKRLMAVDISLDNGILTIEGESDRNNVAIVEFSQNQIQVDAWQYQVFSPGNFEGELNHRDRTYDIDEVDRIVFLGGDANNALSVVQDSNVPSGSFADKQIEFQGGESGDIFNNETWIPSIAYGYGGQLDVLKGGFGNDRLFGGDGADQLIGKDGDDRLDGGKGADFIRGSMGNDILFGRGDTDLLDGGFGEDKIYAGGGHDLVFGEMSFTPYGNGSFSGNQEQYDFAHQVDELWRQDHPIHDVKEIDQILRDTLGPSYDAGLESGESASYYENGVVYTDNDRIYGQGGNDVIYGASGADFISGGTGDDLLLGGSGADRIYGVNGNDVIRGGTGNDLADGGNGSDYIFGGDGLDRLFGRGGLDYLRGDSGNDYLNGGFDARKDILIGGLGKDRIVAEYVAISKPTPYSIPLPKVVEQERTLDFDSDLDIKIVVKFYPSNRVQK